MPMVRVAAVVLLLAVDDAAIVGAVTVLFAMVGTAAVELIESGPVGPLAVVVAAMVLLDTMAVLVALKDVVVAFKAVVVADAINEVLEAATVVLDATDDEATWP